MSRHRRQASQALPADIFAADDLTKPFDFTQSIAGETVTATGATVSLSQGSHLQTHQEIKDSHLTKTSPAKKKSPPPPPKSA